jgi:hypothetical protein
MMRVQRHAKTAEAMVAGVERWTEEFRQMGIEGYNDDALRALASANDGRCGESSFHVFFRVAT